MVLLLLTHRLVYIFCKLTIRAFIHICFTHPRRIPSHLIKFSNITINENISSTFCIPNAIELLDSRIQDVDFILRLACNSIISYPLDHPFIHIHSNRSVCIHQSLDYESCPVVQLEILIQYRHSSASRWITLFLFVQDISFLLIIHTHLLDFLNSTSMKYPQSQPHLLRLRNPVSQPVGMS